MSEEKGRGAARWNVGNLVRTFSYVMRVSQCSRDNSQPVNRPL